MDRTPHERRRERPTTGIQPMAFDDDTSMPGHEATPDGLDRASMTPKLGETTEALDPYRAMRDFEHTPEPPPTLVPTAPRELHVALQAEGRTAFVKTSGKTGLHVFAPWERQADYDEARAWTLGVAQRVVDALPDQATLERSKVKRGKRVYVDVMQNAKGHHAVPPYVLRAVPGAPVSTPLRWQELTPNLDPSACNLKTIFQRLARQQRDPMAGLLPVFVRSQ